VLFSVATRFMYSQALKLVRHPFVSHEGRILENSLIGVEILDRHSPILLQLQVKE